MGVTFAGKEIRFSLLCDFAVGSVLVNASTNPDKGILFFVDSGNVVERGGFIGHRRTRLKSQAPPSLPLSLRGFDYATV